MMHVIKGWKITGLVALSIGIFSGISIAFHGFDEEAIRTLIRATARSSFCLFLLAFSASSLQRIFSSNWSLWLLRNRRYIGVSFAVSHFFHLFFITNLAVLYPHPFFEEQTTLITIINIIAYSYITTMTLTSFNKFKTKISPKNWKLLHVSGSYFLFFSFAGAYVPRGQELFYQPFIAMIIIVFILRITRKIMSVRK